MYTIPLKSFPVNRILLTTRQSIKNIFELIKFKPRLLVLLLFYDYYYYYLIKKPYLTLVGARVKISWW